MKVTVVVQRYGLEILGGAEMHARHVAERLTPYYEVEALTSCAQNYDTWDNAYPPGEEIVNGVRVVRFPTVQPRPANFRDITDNLYGSRHTLADEVAWACAQGPRVPGLLRHLKQRRNDSDVFIFFTYLYYPTAFGLRLVADKALLVPTAHDEGPIYLSFYHSLFHAPRAILYNTHEERGFVERRFGNQYIPNAIVGVGVDVPAAPDPAAFRARLGLDGPYFLYLGRITEHKGCDELVAYYDTYRKLYPGEAKLVLVGHGEMPLPNLPGLVYGGYLDDTAKFDAIAGAEAMIVPSKYESMSMIALEAWALGKPIVCTARSEVVTGMTRRAQGGLYYNHAGEFSEALHLLVSRPDIAAGLGRQGQVFVAGTYTWDVVIGTYRRFIDEVARAPWE